MRATFETMPKFRSKKLVAALRIFGVQVKARNGSGEVSAVEVVFDDGEVDPVILDVLRKPVPQPGWFLVVYEGGYESFCPGDTFLAGNTSMELLFDHAAEAAHESNRLLCLAMGDSSQPFWEDAPDWQRSSAIAGVKQIWEDPSTTPEQSHANWLAVKEADGWVYGDVKNPEAKTHPCMVPYEALPENQRLKDAMFGRVVRAVLGL